MVKHKWIKKQFWSSLIQNKQYLTNLLVLLTKISSDKGMKTSENTLLHAFFLVFLANTGFLCSHFMSNTRIYFFKSQFYCQNFFPIYFLIEGFQRFFLSTFLLNFFMTLARRLPQVTSTLLAWKIAWHQDRNTREFRIFICFICGYTLRSEMSYRLVHLNGNYAMTSFYM